MEKFSKAELIVLYAGILNFILAWIIELNFHFSLFPSNEFDDNILLRGEFLIAPISTFLLVSGIIFIIIAYRLRENRISTGRKKTKSKKVSKK